MQVRLMCNMGICPKYTSQYFLFIAYKFLVENVLPLLSDKDFVPRIHEELSELDAWEWPELGAAVQFAWGVTLRMCSQYASNLVGALDPLEEDDAVVTMAIVHDAFTFYRRFVIGSRNFYEEVRCTKGDISESYKRGTENLRTIHRSEKMDKEWQIKTMSGELRPCRTIAAFVRNSMQYCC